MAEAQKCVDELDVDKVRISPSGAAANDDGDDDDVCKVYSSP